VQDAAACGWLGESVFRSALGFARSWTTGERYLCPLRLGVRLQRVCRQGGTCLGGLLGLEGT
jgi:hypothetical protein